MKEKVGGFASNAIVQVVQNYVGRSKSSKPVRF